MAPTLMFCGPTSFDPPPHPPPTPQVAELIHRAVVIAKDVQAKVPPNSSGKVTLKDFKEFLEVEVTRRTDVTVLRDEVEEFAQAFPMPGL